LAEPKVQSPHKARRGYAPRRIEVERKKREYSLFNITEELENNGVITALLKAKRARQTSDDTIDQYSLTLFDDTEYDTQPAEFWIDLVSKATASGGAVARAMFEMPPAKKKPFVIGAKKEDLSWRKDLFWPDCVVRSFDAERDLFEVFFPRRPPRARMATRQSGWSAFLSVLKLSRRNCIASVLPTRSNASIFTSLPSL